MGYKDPDQFIPPAQPQPPQPDPAVQLEPIKQQGAQILAQANGQIQERLKPVDAPTTTHVENMKQQIGRAACRERVGQSVTLSVVPGSLINKTKTKEV